MLHDVICKCMGGSTSTAPMGGVLGVAKLKYTMERLLVTARELSTKVESNEAAAGDLLKQCETLQQQLKALRQVIPVTLVWLWKHYYFL